MWTIQKPYIRLCYSKKRNDKLSLHTGKNLCTERLCLNFKYITKAYRREIYNTVSHRQVKSMNTHTWKWRAEKNYSREFKLEVVGLYHTSNLYRTKNQYNMNTKTILRWVKQERELIISKRGSKRLKGSRKATLPKLEERLIKEIDQQRQKGLRVKRWWIISRAKQINKETSGRTDGQPENIMPPAPSVRRHKN